MPSETLRRHGAAARQACMRMLAARRCRRQYRRHRLKTKSCAMPTNPHPVPAAKRCGWDSSKGHTNTMLPLWASTWVKHSIFSMVQAVLIFFLRLCALSGMGGLPDSKKHPYLSHCIKSSWKKGVLPCLLLRSHICACIPPCRHGQVGMVSQLVMSGAYLMPA